MDNELCPICMDNSATYFTECNHGYCIGCLSRIKKCSMCRKSLLRSQLCIQIKVNVIINPVPESESVTATVSEYNQYFNTVTRTTIPGINIYSFSLTPEPETPAITNNLRLHFNHPLSELTWLSSLSRY